MANRSTSFDVAVVGGGVIGLAAAWRAVRRGMRVAVLERRDPGSGASSVAAGMLAPISEANLSERNLLALSLEGARLYPRFVAELSDASGLDPGYLGCGTIAVARDADEARALERELGVRQELELPVQRLLPSQARRLEPALAPTARLALAVPDDHAIDPRTLTAALAEAFRREGGELRASAAVSELLWAGGRVHGIRLEDGDTVGAEQVVIAAGPWSATLSGIPQEARIPVHPVKGQILRMHDPAGAGLLERVVRMSGGYLVPRADGRYVLGATVEERGFDTTVTAGAVFELLREAVELVPALSELVIDEISAGLRPSTPDNAPAIGPGAIPGLHWATGHYRHGILLAPITAEILGEALSGAELPGVAAPFSPQRFASAPVRASRKGSMNVALK